MKRPSFFLATLVLALSWGALGTASATTRFVDPAGSDAANDCSNSASPCQTFSNAISQAIAGDTISAAAGTYDEVGLLVGKNLTIVGAGQTTTIIDAQGGTGPILEFDSATVTVSNLTVENASQGDNCGGGIYNHVDAVLALTNVTVRHNTTDVGTVGGGICNEGQLSLQNSLIGGTDPVNDGNITLADGNGGGIYNSGELVLDNTTVSGNSTQSEGGCAGDGGGIFNQSGNVTIRNGSAINNNIANAGGVCGFLQDGNGGGIFNFVGTVVIDNSIVNDNQAMSEFMATAVGGGGIYNQGGDLTIRKGSTISGNLAVAGPLASASAGGQGGGIYHTSAVCEVACPVAPNMAVSDTTISGNTAFMDGGAIYRDNPMTLTNVTISGNASLQGEGGALYNNGTTGACQQPPCVGTLVNVTIADNQAFAVGGVSGDDPNITTAIKNSLFSQNIQTSDNTGTNCDPAATTLSSQDYNLSDDGSCTLFFTQGNDKNSTPAGINALANNGGNWPANIPFTHALQVTSAAVDAIPPGNCAPLTADERNLPRPGVGLGPNCDIGAFELQIQPTPSPIPTPTPPVPAIFLEGSGLNCSLNVAAVPAHGASLLVLLLASIGLAAFVRKGKAQG